MTGDADIRRTEQDDLIDATMLRGFARAALDLDAVHDKVRDLLYEHVVEDRYHPSVVAESLRPLIDELLNTMTRADWQLVADELIAEARTALGKAEPTRPSTGARRRRR